MTCEDCGTLCRFHGSRAVKHPRLGAQWEHVYTCKVCARTFVTYTCQPHNPSYSEPIVYIYMITKVL